jgi:hypothetical protein
MAGLDSARHCARERQTDILYLIMQGSSTSQLHPETLRLRTCYSNLSKNKIANPGKKQRTPRLVASRRTANKVVNSKDHRKIVSSPKWGPPDKSRTITSQQQDQSLLDDLANQVLAVDRVALLDAERADLAGVGGGDDHFLLQTLLARLQPRRGNKV